MAMNNNSEELKQLTTDELIEKLDYCGYDPYYDLLRDPIIEEIKRRMNGFDQRKVVPHRNYKYLSDYWCLCGWHLGKLNSVKYCANCGRKIRWSNEP